MKTRRETIGQRVKRLRLEQGLSQRHLAEPGISYAYISRIEAETRQPSLKVLRQLADRLGVTALYLETGSNSVRARTAGAMPGSRRVGHASRRSSVGEPGGVHPVLALAGREDGRFQFRLVWRRVGASKQRR